MYSHGWIGRPNFLGEKLIEHSGSVLIYTGFVSYVLEGMISVAVLSNCAGYPLSNICMHVMYAFTFMLDKDPEESLDFVRSDRILQRLVGSYEGYKKSVAFDVKRSEFLIMEMMSRNLKLSSILAPEKVEKTTSNASCCRTSERWTWSSS